MRLSNEYIAGFFDGEGSISITVQPRTVNGKVYERSDLWLSITQMRPAVLYQIAEQHQGRVYERKARATRSGEMHRRWDWVATAAQGATFLRYIRPYLIVKADEADVAIKFYQTFELVKELGLGTRNGTPPEIREERLRLVEEMRLLRINNTAIAYDGLTDLKGGPHEIVQADC